MLRTRDDVPDVLHDATTELQLRRVEEMGYAVPITHVPHQSPANLPLQVICPKSECHPEREAYGFGHLTSERPLLCRPCYFAEHGR